MTQSPSATSAIFVLRSVRSWNGGTGLDGNSRGNPVMGHSPHGLDKLLIRPTRVARPVLAAPGTSPRHDTSHQDGQGEDESPGTTSTNPGRPQPQPAPARQDSQVKSHQNRACRVKSGAASQ